MFRICGFNRCCRNCNCNRDYKKCYYRAYENREKKEYDITMEQLKVMQLEGATVIDIRSTQEFKEGHINGAIVIPEYEIYRTIARIIPNKDSRIIVYCDTGLRSISALKILKRMGYTNVYNLYKGMENY
ncbi:MAG: rhodanese-like domain-containing protein [Clostridia bacterium]|nr:rhodanese-like domain-containing protein [Clostridia bacterium]